VELMKRFVVMMFGVAALVPWGALADAADQMTSKLGAGQAAVEKLKASTPTKQNECTLFYNCISDLSVCWWDHWC
jgi:hypothetical protein